MFGRTEGFSRHYGDEDIAHGPAVLEPLEPRLYMSADSLPQTVDIEWAGYTTQAVANEWVVRFNATDVKISDIESQLSASGFIDAELTSLGGGFGVLSSEIAALDQLQAWVDTVDEVVYIEPNFVHSMGDVQVDAINPSDPSFSTLWGLNNTGQLGGTVDADIDAPEAWDITTGSSDVVIAIIDTGIDYNHIDLSANIWTNPGEIAGDGIDNDGNGFVDDVHGWDFANDDGNPLDDHGHGTHVAGTIGAVGGNATGVTGVNWNVKMMAMKFLDGGGSGSTADAIYSINYITMMKRDYGINIVAANNSWGGGGYSNALYQAVEQANDAGILFIAAAGNEGTNNEVTPHYPSSLTNDNVISVASTTRTDSLSGFSCYGVTSVDLAAPGSYIYSTTPGNNYATYSGTSMATPHVTGVVGLLAAYNPNATAAEIKAAILAGVDEIVSLAGKTLTGGRLNAFKALQALGAGGGGEDVTPPSVLSVTPSGTTVQADMISVNFSEQLDADSLEGSNFLLRSSGADGVFDTGDDDIITIETDDISNPSGNWISLQLDGELDAGEYRLTLLGTGINPLSDVAGNTLADGSDVIRTFTVLDLADDTEQNDTLATAMATGLGGIGQVQFAGWIGNGAYGTKDVDMYEFTAASDMLLTVDLDTASDGSTLTGGVRVFNASGNELVFSIDRDSDAACLVFEIDEAGTYTVGVSGHDNLDYAATSNDSGQAGSTGLYGLTMSLAANDITDDPTTSPDGGGYYARVTGFVFEDISGVGNSALRPTSDDVSYGITSGQLSGFNFEFYGQDVTSLYVSSNGLLSFGQGNTDYRNTDLLASPSQAVLAAFWDDLVVGGNDDSEILWDIRGSGDDQRLIVQWNDLRHYGSANGQDITFQAVMYESDNSIRFNYLDLQVDDITHTEARSATIGIKDAGAQGASRLLLSYNQASSPFVGSGTSTLIVQGEVPEPTPQYADLTCDIVYDTITQTVVPGQRGVAYVTIANVGQVATKTRVTINFYASADTTLDVDTDILLTSYTNQRVSLSAGAVRMYRARLVVPGDLLPDSYHLIAKVDADDALEESNEDNNVAVSAETMDVVWRFGNFDGMRNVRLTVKDASGNLVRFSLRGNGYGEVTGGTDFSRIELHGTTNRSTLQIATQRRAVTTVGDIVADGSLRGIIGRYANLGGDVSIAGSLSLLMMGNVTDGAGGTHSIDINTAGGGAGSQVMIRLGEVEDTSIDTNGADIRALYVTNWLDTDGQADVIDANSIRTMRVLGNRRTGVAGDFGGEITLSGASRRGRAFGSMIVAGTVFDGSITAVAGGVGTVRVGAWNGGAITANSVRSLRTSAGRGGLTTGNFSSDLTLSGTGVTGRAKTLGSAKIAGDLTSNIWDISGNVGRISVKGTIGGGVELNSTIRVSGNIQSITAQKMSNVDILAGVGSINGQHAEQQADFLSNASRIGSLTITGDGTDNPAFTNSTVSAWKLGKVRLTNVDSADSGMFVRSGLSGGGIGRLNYLDTVAGRSFSARTIDDMADELSGFINIL